MALCDEQTEAPRGKVALRSWAKERRAALSGPERECADERIAQQLFAMPWWRRAEAVPVYLSAGSEVDTRGIIECAWREGKTVLLPRCVPEARQLAWYRVDSFDGLERGAFGIAEPPADSQFAFDPFDACVPQMLAVVPGLLFDANGYRLGYGGGYYDGFLARFPGLSVGLCRAAQLVDDLRARGAVEPHDLPVDVVLSA